MAFTLPDLPYPFNALEPHIDAKTMEIHHDKHHGTYVSKLNAALEKAPSFQGRADRGDPALPRFRSRRGPHRRPQPRRRAPATTACSGRCSRPRAGGKPSGALATAIDRSFGSFDAFKEQFGNAAANLFGSGWAWLCADAAGKLVDHRPCPTRTTRSHRA